MGRLSTTKELQTAPDPSLLWAAKEAAFKCLILEQNRLIKHISITEWEKTASDSYHFRFQVEGQNTKGRGAAFPGDDLALGFALLP